MRRLSFIVLSVVAVCCTNESDQLWGQYERRLSLTGRNGIERLELDRSGLATTWNYAADGYDREMKLSAITYGKWKLTKNRVEISTDSVYEYSDQGKIVCTMRKTVIDSIFDYRDLRTPKRDYRGTGPGRRVLLLAKDTSQMTMLLAKDNDPVDAWKTYSRLK